MPFVAEAGDHRGERPVRAAGQPGPDDPQRQRQVPTESDEGTGIARRRPHPLRSAMAGQHRQRGRLSQLTDPDMAPHIESGQDDPAGQQHRGAGQAGQQRADLSGVHRVVQHDQHPPVGQRRPQQGEVLGHRDRGRCDPQRT
jgi:hypothetical protein